MILCRRSEGELKTIVIGIVYLSKAIAFALLIYPDGIKFPKQSYTLFVSNIEKKKKLGLCWHTKGKDINFHAISNGKIILHNLSVIDGMKYVAVIKLVFELS